MQEFSPDPVVHSDTASNIVNVTPDRIAEIGDLVYKSDLRCQKCIGSIFDKLSGFERCNDDRRFYQVERPVEVLHDGDRVFLIAPYDDPVRTHKIADSRTFSQEFRV